MKTVHYMLILVIVPVLANTLLAQDVFPLWEGQEIPYYRDNTLVEFEEESWGVMCVLNVTQPTLTVYAAQGDNTGKAVIVIPGGGYAVEAIYHEGYDLAEELAKNGITAAVLKYRIPDTASSVLPHLVPMTDGRRALKLLRSLKNRYGIHTGQVGVIGFSAGSHLSAVLSVWPASDPDENPDFSGLVYGVTSMTEENIEWLEKDLYYRKMTRAEIEQNTLLNFITENTPPAFLVHAYDDTVCRVEESTEYAEQLHENGVQVEMHLFPEGGHGFGMGRAEDGTDQWVSLFINWLKLHDF